MIYRQSAHTNTTGCIHKSSQNMLGTHKNCSFHTNKSRITNKGLGPYANMLTRKARALSLISPDLNKGWWLRILAWGSGAEV